MILMGRESKRNSGPLGKKGVIGCANATVRIGL